MTLAGTASGSITSVVWSNDRGGSGTATGTTAWSVNGITLQTGVNLITVTAKDSRGRTATDSLAVTYSPPDPVPLPPSDLLAPLITIVTKDTQRPRRRTAAVTVTDETAIGSVTVLADGVTLAHDTLPDGVLIWSQTFTLSNARRVTVSVTAQDRAGNQAFTQLVMAR